MKTKLFSTSLMTALLLLLIYGFGYFLLKTDAGTHTVATWVSALFPNVISYESISGQLLGNVEITHLKYHSNEADIQVGHLLVHSKLKLFSLKIEHKYLTLEDIHIIPHYLSTKQSSSKKRTIPFQLTANRILLKNIHIHLYKNKIILLPWLQGSLALSPKKVDFYVYKEPKRSYFKWVSTKNTIDLNLNIPVEKTTWLIHYANEDGELKLSGIISDKANGKIKLLGTGKKNCSVLLTLTAENFHIHHLFQHYWPGIVSFELKLKQQPHHVDIFLDHINGNIHQQPLTGNGQLSLDKKSISNLFLNVMSRQSKIVIVGERDQQLHINWLLEIPKLELFFPKSSGQILAKGKIEGDSSKPVLMGDIFTKNFHFANYHVEKGDGHFFINTQLKEFNSACHLQASNIHYKNILLSHVELTGNATARQNKDKDDIKLNIQLKPVTFFYKLNNEQQTDKLNGGKLAVTLNKDNMLEARVDLCFPEGKINSHMILPRFSFAPASLKQQRISGKVTCQWTALHILESIIPTIKKAKGEISGDFNLNGTLSNPVLKGNLDLKQGFFQIPKLNLKASNVLIRARSEGKNVSYQGTLRSGKGILQFKGNSQFENGTFSLDSKLQGTNILICNKPGIKIVASPNMYLNLSNKVLHLTGNILIPEANLHPHDFENIETASEDIVFVEADGKKIPTGSLRIVSSVALTLGNNIYLNSKGMKGQILGQIRIEDDPNKATVAYGQLRLQSGSYTIYGRTLQIDDGILNFTGDPITNPGLNIHASRTLQISKANSLFATQEQLKVGVSVLGTLRAPKINLFSEPTGRNPADILSYLLLGVPVNAVSGTNTGLLLQAADALNANGTNKILNLKNQIKKGLGLSDLDINTHSEVDPKTQETFQHTAFVLGKYLSPKFYINYSLDIFDHTNTLKVRYLLNKFWTIQSVANTNGSGIDVLYTFEK